MDRPLSPSHALPQDLWWRPTALVDERRVPRRKQTCAQKTKRCIFIRRQQGDTGVPCTSPSHPTRLYPPEWLGESWSATSYFWDLESITRRATETASQSFVPPITQPHRMTPHPLAPAFLFVSRAILTDREGVAERRCHLLCRAMEIYP